MFYKHYISPSCLLRNLVSKLILKWVDSLTPGTETSQLWSFGVNFISQKIIQAKKPKIFRYIFSVTPLLLNPTHQPVLLSYDSYQQGGWKVRFPPRRMKPAECIVSNMLHHRAQRHTRYHNSLLHTRAYRKRWLASINVIDRGVKVGPSHPVSTDKFSFLRLFS